MKLLTAALKKKFAKIGSQQDVEDPIVVVKYFIPRYNWTFYVTEFDPSTNILGGIFHWTETEWGTLGLHHLDMLGEDFGQKVERDKFFKSCRLSEIQELKTTKR